MLEIPSFNSYIERSIIQNWDLDALTDYQGTTLQYKDVARKIEKLHILFENSGVRQGDKIALCGRNSAFWATAFLATLTYGAVAVPIQHEFNAEQIHNIVNHSEAKLLFVGDVVATIIKPDEMPALEGIIYIPDYSVFTARTEKLVYAREHLNELYGRKYPKYFRPEHVHYHVDTAEELALINYTSGTTGFSKGVMLPYRSLYTNINLAYFAEPQMTCDSDVVAMLPSAHMYGLMFELIYEMVLGCHVHFLTRVPSPKIIMKAFQEIHPDIIIAVPLIMEKVYKTQLKPIADRTRPMMYVPLLAQAIQKKIRDGLITAFGGRFEEVILGGAAFNPEVENFLRKIHFPFTVGYGMTECGPIITYEKWFRSRKGSCGKAIPGCEIRIDSSNPHKIPGEVQIKGGNVFLGYYKNREETP